MKNGTSAKSSSSGGMLYEEEIQREAIQSLTPLRTKLSVPQFRSAWISRSRLIKRMDEGLGRKLTLISAPAGYGKTTLLADWIYQQKIATAWLSLDKNDNDPLHFLTYVILGFQRLEAGIGKAVLTMLQSPQPPPIESILIHLINDLSSISTDHALVIDDYHAVDAKPIHDMIAFLLDHQPMVGPKWIQERSRRSRVCFTGSFSGRAADRRSR